jgi:hypothetical protein
MVYISVGMVGLLFLLYLIIGKLTSGSSSSSGL